MSFENLLPYCPFHGGLEVIGFPLFSCGVIVLQSQVSNNHSFNWVTDDTFVHTHFHINSDHVPSFSCHDV